MGGHGDHEFSRDADLVKAALLYGDWVTLSSQSFQMSGFKFVVGRTDPAHLLDLFRHDPPFHPEVMAYGEAGFAFIWQFIYHNIGNPVELEASAGHVAAIEAISTLQAQTRNSDDLVLFESLQPVIDARQLAYIDIVRAHGPGTYHIDWDSPLDYLAHDPHLSVLCDAATAEFAKARINSGALILGDSDLDNAKRALIGTGLLSRLPAFPELTFMDTLSLRDDLAEPLGNYRAAVGELRELVEVGPFDRGVDHQVLRLFADRVWPEVVNLKRNIGLNGIVRDVRAQAWRTLMTGAAGGAAGDQVDLLIEPLDVVSDTWRAAIGAGVGVATDFAERTKSRHAANKSHDFLYLYETNKYGDGTFKKGYRPPRRPSER